MSNVTPNEHPVGFLTVYPKGAAAKWHTDMDTYLLNLLPANTTYQIFVRPMPEWRMPVVQPQDELV